MSSVLTLAANRSFPELSVPISWISLYGAFIIGLLNLDRYSMFDGEVEGDIILDRQDSPALNMGKD